MSFWIIVVKCHVIDVVVDVVVDVVFTVAVVSAIVVVVGVAKRGKNKEKKGGKSVVTT